MKAFISSFFTKDIDVNSNETQLEELCVKTTTLITGGVECGTHDSGVLNVIDGYSADSNI